MSKDNGYYSKLENTCFVNRTKYNCSITLNRAQREHGTEGLGMLSSDKLLIQNTVMINMLSEVIVSLFVSWHF